MPPGPYYIKEKFSFDAVKLIYKHYIFYTRCWGKKKLTFPKLVWSNKRLSIH